MIGIEVYTLYLFCDRVLFLVTCLLYTSLLANARRTELGYPGGFTKGMKFRGNQYTGRIRVE